MGFLLLRLLFRFRLEIDFRSVDVGEENKERLDHLNFMEIYGG